MGLLSMESCKILTFLSHKDYLPIGLSLTVSFIKVLNSFHHTDLSPPWINLLLSIIFDTAVNRKVSFFVRCFIIGV